MVKIKKKNTAGLGNINRLIKCFAYSVGAIFCTASWNEGVHRKGGLIGIMYRHTSGRRPRFLLACYELHLVNQNS